MQAIHLMLNKHFVTIDPGKTINVLYYNNNYYFMLKLCDMFCIASTLAPVLCMKGWAYRVHYVSHKTKPQHVNILLL